MNQPTYQSFVERRLGEPPLPPGNDAKDRRYWVGAGEVMLDLLLAATNPSNSDLVLEKLHRDIAAGDSTAEVANQLLNVWAVKKESGNTGSLGAEFPEDAAPTIVQAYRALTLLYAGAADAEKIATLDAVLTVKAGHGNLLATTLKIMLDTAVNDLTGLARSAVQRNSSEPPRGGASLG